MFVYSRSRLPENNVKINDCKYCWLKVFSWDADNSNRNYESKYRYLEMSGIQIAMLNTEEV